MKKVMREQALNPLPFILVPTMLTTMCTTTKQLAKKSDAGPDLVNFLKILQILVGDFGVDVHSDERIVPGRLLPVGHRIRNILEPDPSFLVKVRPVLDHVVDVESNPGLSYSG